MRGEERRDRLRHGRRRITPACAGRRLCNSGAVRLVEDHPRVCGEKRSPSRISGSIEGSPPRVRGEDGAQRKNERLRRITPACAGRSVHRATIHTATADHPRVCGEKSASWPAGWTRWITPACAGRSSTLWLGAIRRTDHPRVCGEKQVSPLTRQPQRGSPPRVRGEDTQVKILVKHSRITPACAGRSTLV